MFRSRLLAQPLQACTKSLLPRMTVMPSARRALIASSVGNTCGALTLQRRTQYAQSGNRDQEAFLSQYDPMEVLGLSSDCTVEDIDKAFEERKAFYGANGAKPNPQMVDRVFRAHEILKDPESPYYMKAHSSQVDRQRLQFQLLPKSKRRLIEVQVGILMCVVVGLVVGTILICFQPVKKTKRAALR